MLNGFTNSKIQLIYERLLKQYSINFIKVIKTIQIKLRPFGFKMNLKSFSGSYYPLAFSKTKKFANSYPYFSYFRKTDNGFWSKFFFSKRTFIPLNMRQKRFYPQEGKTLEFGMRKKINYWRKSWGEKFKLFQRFES